MNTRSFILAWILLASISLSAQSAEFNIYRPSHPLSEWQFHAEGIDSLSDASTNLIVQDFQYKLSSAELQKLGYRPEETIEEARQAAINRVVKTKGLPVTAVAKKGSTKNPETESASLQKKTKVTLRSKGEKEAEQLSGSEETFDQTLQTESVRTSSSVKPSTRSKGTKIYDARAAALQRALAARKSVPAVIEDKKPTPEIDEDSKAKLEKPQDLSVPKSASPAIEDKKPAPEIDENSTIESEKPQDLSVLKSASSATDEDNKFSQEITKPTTASPSETPQSISISKSERQRPQKKVAAILSKRLAENAIIGSVTDEEGNPLNSAKIELYDLNNVLLQSTLSDKKGDYFFKQLRDGDYYIKIMANGCSELEIQGIQVSNSVGVFIGQHKLQAN